MEPKIHILEAADRPSAAVWDRLRAHAEVTMLRDGQAAYDLLRQQKFDLVLINLVLPGLDGLELLRRVCRQSLCPLVVLTSEAPSFTYAQQGIRYGAFDYLLRPLDEKSVKKLLFRAMEAIFSQTNTTRWQCDAVVQQMRTRQACEMFRLQVEQIERERSDAIHADIAVKQMYSGIVERTFLRMPWLDRFVYPGDYELGDILCEDAAPFRDVCSRRLMELNEQICQLYPATEDEKLDAILLYLLEHVDEGCLQREVAAVFYLSNAALSERFQRGLNKSYRVHVTDIKMLRAQFLLRHSDMKMYEISALLGY